MKTVLIFILTLLFTAACGCCSDFYKPLHFNESSNLIPRIRLTADKRYHLRNGWDNPALPGSDEALLRECCERKQGGGITLRLFANISHRTVEDKDGVLPTEFVEVNGTRFNEGEVTGRFRINRQEFGGKAGGFNDKFYLGGGVALFLTGVQMRGSVSNATQRATVNKSNGGLGLGVWLEISPGYPPLKFYLDWRFWIDEWFQLGEDREVGIKFQYRSFEIFLGYRMEYFQCYPKHNGSRLIFKILGPVFGLGLAL